MQSRFLRLPALALALALAMGPAQAFAWSNGPSYGAGFGTHDWVMYKANALAISRGATWVDVNAAMDATDDPDMVLRDTYYHIYDVWGSTNGNSPAKVAECYAQATAALRAGDSAGASRWVGLLSHYYSDTCNPLHTDQSDAEEGMHSDYESAVDDTTTGAGSLASWVTDDGYQHVDDAAAITRDAAYSAHPYHSALVSGYVASGLSAVQGITQAHLNRAVNGLADVIKSIQDDAFPFVPAPNAVYRFYNRANGTHFYTPSVDEALTVIARWSNVYTYEGIAYFADPAKNNQSLYRFYNRNTGSHFYTASLAEANTVVARWSNVYSYDGPTYSVLPAPAPGGAPVYRFYHRGNGSHFYTISAEEADTVIARWSNVYEYEGVAFWVGQ